jgi:hypothetical protein
LIKDEECHEGADVEFDTLILDEEKFLDVLEPIMEAGGAVCKSVILALMLPRYADILHYIDVRVGGWVKSEKMLN